MRRSLLTSGFAIAFLVAPALLLPDHRLVSTAGAASDRALPMRFDLRRQGPAGNCDVQCATLISASGAITADSARDFKRFLQGRNLRFATVVLDSDGGSVLGAIALGREIRKAAFATTVGRVVDVDDKGTVNSGEAPRAVLSPRADCESMCAFVLLGGAQRFVPPEARVMVHQIWLGDRREDPTAASYSAEDLVLVQRDIGRLAQYTAEMGASIDLLDLALRIPPWEPLHSMTREEIHRTRLATVDSVEVPPATVAVSPALPAARPLAPATSGARATPISERRWAMVEGEGSTTLARRHPLTVAGDSIGSFDLVLACGADPDRFDLSYIERRHAGAGRPLPERLSDVNLRAGRTKIALTLAASERSEPSGELVSAASASVPAEMVRAFAAAGHQSMVIQTTGGDKVTLIRIGNTGAQHSLPQLVARCARPLGDRAEAIVHKTDVKSGGMSLAR